MKYIVSIIALSLIPTVGLSTETKTPIEETWRNIPTLTDCIVYRSGIAYECEENIVYVNCDNDIEATANIIFNITQGTITCEKRKDVQEKQQ